MNAFTAWGPGRWSVLLAVTFLTLANVSHTIALRYLLLAIMLCWAVADRRLLWDGLRQSRPAAWLAALLLYAGVHSVFVSAWSEVSIAEWRSQLLMGGLWFVAGTVLFQRKRDLSILDCVALSGLLLVSAEVALTIHYRMVNGNWPFMMGFTTATKLEFTFFVNFALAFVATLIGFGKGKTVFPLWTLLLMGGLMFFASYHAGARNGLIGMTYLVVSFLLIYLLVHRQQLGVYRILVLSFVVMSALAAFVYSAVQKDYRNSVFFESMTIGLNDDVGIGWRRVGPYPLLSNGKVVDISAYERPTWIKAGLGLIKENPLGYGFDRRTFGKALALQGKPNTLGHSHSGFIDLGVGLGVPGIILWLGFCFSMIWYGFVAFSRRQDMAGLALMLVTSGFMGRMVLESVSKDHMLHIFLFTAAALYVQIKRNQADKPNV